MIRSNEEFYLLDGRLRVSIGEGRSADPLAFWQAGSDAARRAVLWELPAHERPAFFVKHVTSAPIVAAFRLDGWPLGLCWLHPISAGAKSASIHFYFSYATEHAEDIARHVLARLPHALIAIMPVAWRHARRFAAKVGFYEIARLPGACRLADWDRLVDGSLVLRRGNF